MTDTKVRISSSNLSRVLELLLLGAARAAPTVTHIKLFTSSYSRNTLYAYKGLLLLHSSQYYFFSLPLTDPIGLALLCTIIYCILSPPHVNNNTYIPYCARVARSYYRYIAHLFLFKFDFSTLHLERTDREHCRGHGHPASPVSIVSIHTFCICPAAPSILIAQ